MLYKLTLKLTSEIAACIAQRPEALATAKVGRACAVSYQRVTYYVVRLTPVRVIWSTGHSCRQPVPGKGQNQFLSQLFEFTTQSLLD